MCSALSFTCSCIPLWPGLQGKLNHTHPKGTLPKGLQIVKCCLPAQEVSDSEETDRAVNQQNPRPRTHGSRFKSQLHHYPWCDHQLATLLQASGQLDGSREGAGHEPQDTPGGAEGSPALSSSLDLFAREARGHPQNQHCSLAKISRLREIKRPAWERVHSREEVGEDPRLLHRTQEATAEQKPQLLASVPNTNAHPRMA